MKWQWLHKTGASSLLLFCNGLGMDERVVAHLEPGEYDLLMLYDYDSLELPEEVVRALKEYDAKYLLAWSMGVWVAAQLFADVRFMQAVAINGTLCPIHDQFGIPFKIFHGTWRYYDEENRKAFYRRMCDRVERQRFLLREPRRSLENQRRELAFFLERRGEMAVSQTVSPFWTKVVISRRDMIVPTKNQKAFWSETAVTELPGGHYPFFNYAAWDDYLGL